MRCLSHLSLRCRPATTPSRKRGPVTLLGRNSRVFAALGRKMAPFLGAVLTALVILGFLSTGSRAQQLLPNTLQIDEGVSVSYPDGWSVGQPAMHSWVLLNVPANQQQTATPTAQVAIGYLVRPSADDAVSQLAQYANESSVSPTQLTIGGWPAFQRVQLVDRQQPGDGPLFADPQTVEITTAVAANNLLVRLEASLPSDADQTLQGLVLAIGQSLTFNSNGGITQKLKKPGSSPGGRGLSDGGSSLPAHPTPLPATPPRPLSDAVPQTIPPGGHDTKANTESKLAASKGGSHVAPVKQVGGSTSNNSGETFPSDVNALASDDGGSFGGPSVAKGDTVLPEKPTTLGDGLFLHFIPDPPISPLAQLPNGSNGELEMAISNNGSDIVVGKQGGAVTSNDGGQTFPFGSGLSISDGDSSVAFGQSGDFFHAGLSCFGTSCSAPCPGASPSGTPASTNNCVVVAPSTNGAQTFGALVNSAVCASSGGSACFLDQEHIAADRINAGTGGADRVYDAVRNCQGGCGTNGAFVTCSPDGDATWAPLLALEKGSDYPRVAVGGDGSFYVVYELGGNVRLDKFSACSTSASQMTRASSSFPLTVSSYNNFAGCATAGGFAGLDRCNSGNTLTGPTVTVDDTNPNHVYVAWSNNTAANNDNILVVDSTTGGTSWGTPVTVNASATARRFHPWACATGGNAYLTWYDRRAATAANNDLTDYFAASAGVSGGSLAANNDEFKISTSSDAQCNLWPGAPRSVYDSENCSVQPQLAGVCELTPIPTPDTSSKKRCDFVTGPACPFNPSGTETCQTGGGIPKYGDYNGNACILGRLCTVFASAAGSSRVGDFFQCYVVSSTPTTLTYTGATTGAYNATVTVSAALTLSGTSAGIGPGQTVTFSVGTQNCSASTNAAGIASCPITLSQVPGPYTVTASFATSGNYQASSASAPFTITKAETAIVFTPASATNADFDDAASVQALLTTAGLPLANEPVTISLGSGVGTETCSVPMTTPAGLATCQITPNQAAGPYTITATFAGDAFYLPSSTSAAFTINKEETTTKFTVSSPTVIADGHPTTFSATLLEDGVSPIQGRTITITIGAQSCPAGPTDLTGTASCTIVPSLVLGPSTLTASFGGDPFYLPSSASEPVLVFAFLNSGSMVIGNLNASPGVAVEFWGAQWAKNNSLSGGSAPDAFKGFASTAPQTCGGGWTTSPGNSSGLPATVPSYMGVIVSSSITQSGSTIAGDVPIIVVVKTNSGYGPSPGHAGTGTVVATFCP
jgi:hypothetical protein